MPYLTSTSGITVDYYFIKFSTNSSIDFFWHICGQNFCFTAQIWATLWHLTLHNFLIRQKAGLFADNLCAVNQAESWK